MRTNSKEVQGKVQDYILSIIDISDSGMINPTIETQLNYVWDSIRRQAFYPNNLKRLKTYQACFIDHLTGLPGYFNQAYSDYDILQLMASWGLPQPADKNTQDSTNLYYYLLYTNFLKLCKKYKVQTNF